VGRLNNVITDRAIYLEEKILNCYVISLLNRSACHLILDEEYVLCGCNIVSVRCNITCTEI